MAFQQFGGNKDLGGLFDAYTGALSQGQQYVQNQLQNDDQAMQNLLDQYRIPMDLRVRAGEAAKGDFQASPEGQAAYGNVQTGQGLSQLSTGQKAQALLPFVIAAEQAKANEEGSQARLFANMYGGLEKQHNQSLDPNEREAGGQGAFFLADTLSRVNPKNMFQERMLGTKTDTALDIAEMNNETKRMALAQAHQKAAAGDKNAQQALVTYYRAQLAAGEITQAEFVMQMAGIFNRATEARTPAGVQVNPAVAPEVLQPKPQAAPYDPNAGKAQPTKPRKPLGEY